MSIETRVRPDMPPVFLVHTAEDRSVPIENSLALVEALRRAGVPVEAHLYERGAHGFGMAADLGTTSDWVPAGPNGCARMAGSDRPRASSRRCWRSRSRCVRRRPSLRSTWQPATSSTWARGIEGQRKADLGDGTYLNPIMSGDHPDPSILKDGDDYYMTFSSFDAYPGLVIWHSRDLVNWQPVGPALFTNVGSVWAPDLVKHGGRYYIYFPGVGPYRSNYVIWADNIRGPWSEPIDLKIGQIDPGHAVGPDGRRYLFLSAGHMVPLADDGLSVIGAPKKVYDGWKYPDDWIVEGFAQEGPEDPEARRLLPHGARRRRHRGSADRAHDRLGALEVDRGPVGELALQPDRPHAVGDGALVVQGARHARRRARRPLVHRLSRLRERLLHAGPPDAARADRVDRRRLVPDRGRRPREADPKAGGEPPCRTAWPSPTTSPPTAWASSGASTRARRAIATRYRYENGALVLKAQGHVAGRLRRRCRSSPATTPTRSRWRSTPIRAPRRACCCSTAAGSTPASASRRRTSSCTATAWIGRRASRPTSRQRLHIRIRNDRHIVTMDYSVDGRAWRRYDRGMELSGYHHNVAYEFLSLRPALYAAGTGEVRFRNFRYRSLP